MAILLTVCWLVPGCFPSVLLTVRRCNELWTCRAASARAVSVREAEPLSASLCRSCFAGPRNRLVAQKHERKLFHQVIRNDQNIFIKISKGKNANHPERKDSESKGCMQLCDDVTPDQKWTL